MELNEFHILQRQARAQHHAAAVAGAGMRAGRGVVGAAVAARREYHGLGAEAVDRTVVEAKRDHADAAAVLHDQVDRKVLDEEVGVVLQALLVQRVEHRMAGAVGRGAGPLGRRPLAHVLHHAAERPLVDRPVLVAAERHAGVLELVDRVRRFADHVLDRVLITEPVRPLDGVEHVPGPVVGRVVAERGGDASLRRHGVAAGREHLGHAGGLETGLGRAHRRAQARAAGADHDDVVSVVDDPVGRSRTERGRRRRGRRGIIGHAPAPRRARRRRLNTPKPAPPIAARLSSTVRAKRFAP